MSIIHKYNIGVSELSTNKNIDNVTRVRWLPWPFDEKLAQEFDKLAQDQFAHM